MGFPVKSACVGLVFLVSQYSLSGSGSYLINGLSAAVFNDASRIHVTKEVCDAKWWIQHAPQVGNFSIVDSCDYRFVDSSVSEGDRGGRRCSQSPSINIVNINGPFGIMLDNDLATSRIVMFQGPDSAGRDILTEHVAGNGAGDISPEVKAAHTDTDTEAETYAASLIAKNRKNTATDSANPHSGTQDKSNGDKKVVGYFTQWSVYARDYHVKNIVSSGSAEKLTHIVYAFGNVVDGRCVIGDTYADYDRFYEANLSVDGKADKWGVGALRGSFNQLRKLKIMYPNIKIVWSFGGWSWSGSYKLAAQSPEIFANSCYDLVNAPRWEGVFDGISIDWVYPNECGFSCDKSGYDGYVNVIKAVRRRFGSALVTAAISANHTKLQAADYGEASHYLDFYMLMSYDFFGAFTSLGPTAPHSPLFDFPSIPEPGFYSENAVQTLQSMGVASEKTLLGLGFYGRGWAGVSQSAPGGSASGPAQGRYELGVEDYHVLKNTCPATGTVGGTAYAHCDDNWWSYDTPATIDGKMDWVNSQNLGGAFFWALSGDTADGELIRAIDHGL